MTRKSYQQGVEDGYSKAVKAIKRIVQGQLDYYLDMMHFTTGRPYPLPEDAIIEKLNKLMSKRKSARRKKKVKK